MEYGTECYLIVDSAHLNRDTLSRLTLSYPLRLACRNELDYTNFSKKASARRECMRHPSLEFIKLMYLPL